jgi:hypothetical protein
MTSWFFEGSGDKNNSGEGRDMEVEIGKERGDERRSGEEDWRFRRCALSELVEMGKRGGSAILTATEGSLQRETEPEKNPVARRDSKLDFMSKSNTGGGGGGAARGVGIPTIEIAGGDWAVVRLLNSEQSGSPLTTVWKGKDGRIDTLELSSSSSSSENKGSN